MSSPILKSFTFVPQPEPNSDSLIIKQDRAIARLDDQKKLLADPNYIRTALGAQGRRGRSLVKKRRPVPPSGGPASSSVKIDTGMSTLAPVLGITYFRHSDLSAEAQEPRREKRQLVRITILVPCP